MFLILSLFENFVNFSDRSIYIYRETKARARVKSQDLRVFFCQRGLQNIYVGKAALLFADILVCSF